MELILRACENRLLPLVVIRFNLSQIPSMVLDKCGRRFFSSHSEHALHEAVSSLKKDFFIRNLVRVPWHALVKHQSWGDISPFRKYVEILSRLFKLTSNGNILKKPLPPIHQMGMQLTMSMNECEYLLKWAPFYVHPSSERLEGCCLGSPIRKAR